MRQGDAEWLAARAACAVTCSEIGTALGIGYRSRSQYMKEKLGLVPAPEVNWRMQQGTEREPYVALLYKHIMENELGRDVVLDTHSFHVHREETYLGGSPDRIVKEGPHKYLLEIKTCPEGDGRDYVPTTHLCQMLGLCEIYDFTRSHYICSTYDKNVYLAEVRFDANLWPQVVVPRLRQFAEWRDNEKIPPRMAKGEAAALEATIVANCDVHSV